MNYLAGVMAAACQALGPEATACFALGCAHSVQATLQWTQGRTWERQTSLKAQPPPAARYPVLSHSCLAAAPGGSLPCGSCPLMLQGPSCMRC